MVRTKKFATRSSVAAMSAQQRTRADSVTAVLAFSHATITHARTQDSVQPAKGICRRLISGKERVTRCFFSEASLARADALAPQLQSVWVAIHPGPSLLLSGRIGFKFAGEGPLPEPSDLVVGSVEEANNRLQYVLSFAEAQARVNTFEIFEDDWLLFDGGDPNAEALEMQERRHSLWLALGIYNGETGMVQTDVLDEDTIGADMRVEETVLGEREREELDRTWQQTQGGVQRHEAYVQARMQQWRQAVSESQGGE